MAAKFFNQVTIKSPKPPLDPDEQCLTWEQHDHGSGGVAQVENCTPDQAIKWLKDLAESIEKAKGKAPKQPYKNPRSRGV